MNTDEEADESVETDQPAEPTFVYEADFHIGGHPGLNYNSIYVGPLHPWLTSIERSDGMLHPFGLSDAGALRDFDSPRLGAPRLHHFDGSQAQLARRAPERGPLPRPRVLEGDHASIVRHQSFLSAALYGLVPLDAIDATPARR